MSTTTKPWPGAARTSFVLSPDTPFDVVDLPDDDIVAVHLEGRGAVTVQGTLVEFESFVSALLAGVDRVRSARSAAEESAA